MKTSKTIEVQWGDIDAAMHVNNVIYLKWVESARVDFLIKMNNGMLVNEEQIGAVIAWLDCKYIRPVMFPDTVRLETVKSEVLTEKIILETKIYSIVQDRLVAISKQEIVSYDFLRKCKVPLPINWT